MRRLFAAGLFLLASAASAQPGENLPDLTPSTFEIQGEVEIALPQLERQPLSGFGPPPRTYVVPAERQPATRPYGPGLDTFAPLALAPPPPPSSDLPQGNRFRAEAGAGLAAARYGRLDAGGTSGRAQFWADLDYDGAGSTVLFGDEPPQLDGEVRFDRVAATGGVGTTGPVRVGLEGHYAQDGYALPGISLGTTEAERTVRHAALTARLDADGEIPAALRLTGSRTTLSSSDSADPIALDPELRFEGTGHVELLRRLVRVEGALGTSSFLPNSGERDLLDYEAGLVLQAHRRDGARFALGARVFGFDTSFLNGSGASTNVIAPVVRAELPLGLAARLFAFTDPGVTQRGFAAFLSENPYATPSSLAPDVRTVDAQAGIEVRNGAVGFKAYGGAVYSPTRLFFEQTGTGFYAPAYDDARVFLVGGDVTYASALGIEATAGVAYRNGQLTDFDEDIPFFAPLVGRAGLQVPFAAGRGRLGVAAYAEGERPSSRAGGTAPGWATLSAYGAYDLRGGLSVVLRGERLAGDAERWPGYPQVPYAVMLGLRLTR